MIETDLPISYCAPSIARNQLNGAILLTNERIGSRRGVTFLFALHVPCNKFGLKNLVTASLMDRGHTQSNSFQELIPESSHAGSSRKRG